LPLPPHAHVTQVDLLEDHLEDFPPQQAAHFRAIGRLAVMAALPEDAKALLKKERQDAAGGGGSGGKKGRAAAGKGTAAAADAEAEAAADAAADAKRKKEASRCRVASRVMEWAAKTCGRITCNGHGVSSQRIIFSALRRSTERLFAA